MPKSNPGKFLRKLLHAPIYLYRWKLGWLLGKRFLLLTHVGRRTSQRHQTILEVMEFRPSIPEFVVMSGFGRTAQWFKNIEVGLAYVAIGRVRFPTPHRILSEEEAVAVVQRYEQRNRLLVPIVRSVLSGLLGWKYRGSDSDRHRLVTQLSLLAFSRMEYPINTEREKPRIFTDENGYRKQIYP